MKKIISRDSEELEYNKRLVFGPSESQKERICVCVCVCVCVHVHVEGIMAENFQNWGKKHRPVEFAGS